MYTATHELSARVELATKTNKGKSLRRPHLLVELVRGKSFFEAATDCSYVLG